MQQRWFSEQIGISPHYFFGDLQSRHSSLFSLFSSSESRCGLGFIFRIFKFKCLCCNPACLDSRQTPSVYKRHSWGETLHLHHVLVITHQRRVSRDFSFEGRLTNQHFNSTPAQFNLRSRWERKPRKDCATINYICCVCEAAGECASVCVCVSVCGRDCGASEWTKLWALRSNEVCLQGQRPREQSSTCRWCHRPSSTNAQDLQLLALKNAAFGSAPHPRSGRTWQADKSNRLFIL